MGSEMPKCDRCGVVGRKLITVMAGSLQKKVCGTCWRKRRGGK